MAQGAAGRGRSEAVTRLAAAVALAAPLAAQGDDITDQLEYRSPDGVVSIKA
jgi:hypothetical protein